MIEINVPRLPMYYDMTTSSSNVCGLYVVTFLNYTPRICEWYMAQSLT